MYKKFVSRLGKNYIYDSISNNVYEINESNASILPDTGETSLLRTLDQSLFDAVYYGYDFDNVASNAIIANRIDVPEVIVIEISQKCNYRCSYCVYSGAYQYERSHSDADMSQSSMNAIIENFFDTTEHPKNVSFYGGEPLLNFDGIRGFVEEIESRLLSVEYYVTTNGELLHDENILSFLVDHGFHINISYDGVNHDCYRKTKSGRKTSKRIEEIVESMIGKYPQFVTSNLRLSITLSPPYRLYENACFFRNHPVLSKVNMLVNSVNLEDNSFISHHDMEAENIQLSKDYRLLADEYIVTEFERLPKFIQALFFRSLGRIEDRQMSLLSEKSRMGCCIPGTQRIFITCSGDYYMCERVGTFANLGSLSEGIVLDRIQSAQHDIDELMNLRCSQCYLSRVCDYCFSVFRKGNNLVDMERINKACQKQREWFDLLFYIFLSKSELENQS